MKLMKIIKDGENVIVFAQHGKSYYKLFIPAVSIDYINIDLKYYSVSLIKKKFPNMLESIDKRILSYKSELVSAFKGRCSYGFLKEEDELKDWLEDWYVLSKQKITREDFLTEIM